MRFSALRAVPALRSVAAATTLAIGLGLVGLAPSAAEDPAALETIPAPADGVFRMVGAGWGHGRGMSQWGAYQAATEFHTHAEILGFYYPGTVLAPITAPPVRVLLTADTGRDLIVRATPGLTATQGEVPAVLLPVEPSPCATTVTRWRVRAMGSYLRLDAYCGRWRAMDKVAGRTLTFTAPDGIVGTQVGSVRRGYRGTITATLTGRRSVQVVNTVAMEEYLRPVVASEVSPSWPEEALRAQAVAARTFAAHVVLSGAKRAFDVYDGTRSQSYPGAVLYDSSWSVVRSREHARTDAAIAVTAGIQVTVDGLPVLTQFSSSNGGATAASPLAHMYAYADPWDAAATKNPKLSWSDSVTVAELRKRYRGLGQVVALEVLAREGFGPWGGRIASLRIVGTQRSYVLSTDTEIRAALGVNSRMLAFSPPQP